MDWPENDFRIFVGDMGPEVTDEVRCVAPLEKCRAQASVSNSCA